MKVALPSILVIISAALLTGCNTTTPPVAEPTVAPRAPTQAAAIPHTTDIKVNSALKTFVSKDKVVVKKAILKSSPVIAYEDQTYCKEYKKITEANGKQDVKFGIACKQPTGKWRMMT